MNVTSQSKSIEWAYPTSDNAAKYGCSRDGCWVIEVTTPGDPPCPFKGPFKDRQQAIQFASTDRNLKDIPYHWAFLKYCSIADRAMIDNLFQIVA